MSSRFGNYDDYREWPMLDYGRWEHNIRQTLKGKRGQRALAEFEAALLAMPIQNLLHGRICEIEVHDPGFGWTLKVPAFCAVGLYAHHKGQSAESLEAVGDVGEQDTAAIGEDAGMSFTMAWHLGELNDEHWHDGMTGGERWHAALDWVRMERAKEAV